MNLAGEKTSHSDGLNDPLDHILHRLTLHFRCFMVFKKF